MLKEKRILPYLIVGCALRTDRWRVQRALPQTSGDAAPHGGLRSYAREERKIRQHVQRLDDGLVMQLHQTEGA